MFLRSSASQIQTLVLRMMPRKTSWLQIQRLIRKVIEIRMRKSRTLSRRRNEGSPIRLKRIMKIAELKQISSRPDVVEVLHQDETPPRVFTAWFSGKE